jgi:hypothetical protein
MVIVIYADEVAQLQVAGSAGSFASNALHGTPVSKEAESVIVDKVKTRLIEYGSRMCLSNCEADSICEALTQRSRGDFDAWSVMGFWMTWSDAIDMLEAGNSQLDVDIALDT